MRSVFFSAVALTLIPVCSSSGAPLAPSTQQGQTENMLVDAVVASVDDKPITLRELGSRLSPPRKLALADVASDAEAMKMLDAMILEKVLEEEAQAKRVSVSDQEVEEYINEVAKRNNLDRPDFEKALAAEGKSFVQYRSQVRLEILRTKLVSALSRGGVSVTAKEVDEYLEDHPELRRAGTWLELRQILVTSEGRTPEEMEARVGKLKGELALNGDFSELARTYSDGPHSADGGSLGLVAQDDLSEDIVAAVSALDEGKVTEIFPAPNGVQVFKLERRLERDEDDDVDESFKAEIRKSLQERKTQERLANYFVTDLFKNHAIEKKM